MIDEMKHLPGAWIWKSKTFYYSIIRSEATWGLLCLVTAAENVSVQFVF